MGRHTSNGQGQKVSKQEVLAYERLRDIGGMSPKAAARTIGRSKSWAYNHEQRRRVESVPPRGDAWKPVVANIPAEVPAVGLCLLAMDGTLEAKAAFLSSLEHRGMEIVFPLVRVVLYLAALRAEDLQREYAEHIKDLPITAADVIETAGSALWLLAEGESLDSADTEIPPELDTFYREWIDLQIDDALATAN